VPLYYLFNCLDVKSSSRCILTGQPVHENDCNLQRRERSYRRCLELGATTRRTTLTAIFARISSNTTIRNWSQVCCRRKLFLTILRDRVSVYMYTSIVVSLPAVSQLTIDVKLTYTPLKPTRSNKHEADLQHTSCTCILNITLCLLNRANGVLIRMVIIVRRSVLIGRVLQCHCQITDN